MTIAESCPSVERLQVFRTLEAAGEPVAELDLARIEYGESLG
jgi:hypothetical protein